MVEKGLHNQKPLFTMTLLLQRHGAVYERKVYDVLSLVGDIGGFNDALILIAEIIVGLFSGCIMKRTLVQDTFKIREN